MGHASITDAPGRADSFSDESAQLLWRVAFPLCAAITSDVDWVTTADRLELCAEVSMREAFRRAFPEESALQEPVPLCRRAPAARYLLGIIQATLAAHRSIGLEWRLVDELVQIRTIAMLTLKSYWSDREALGIERRAAGSELLAACWANGGGCGKVIPVAKRGRPRVYGFGACADCHQHQPRCQLRRRARRREFKPGFFLYAIVDDNGKPLLNPQLGEALGYGGICTACGEEFVSLDSRQTRCHRCKQAHRSPQS